MPAAKGYKKRQFSSNMLKLPRLLGNLFNLMYTANIFLIWIPTLILCQMVHRRRNLLKNKAKFTNSSIYMHNSGCKFQTNLRKDPANIFDKFGCNSSCQFRKSNLQLRSGNSLFRMVGNSLRHRGNVNENTCFSRMIKNSGKHVLDNI